MLSWGNILEGLEGRNRLASHTAFGNGSSVTMGRSVALLLVFSFFICSDTPMEFKLLV